MRGGSGGAYSYKGKGRAGRGGRYGSRFFERHRNYDDDWVEDDSYDSWAPQEEERPSPAHRRPEAPREETAAADDEPSLAALSGLERQLSGWQEDSLKALQEIGRRQNEKFDVIFEILSDLQSRHSQLEESMSALMTQAQAQHAGAQMVSGAMGLQHCAAVGPHQCDPMAWQAQGAAHGLMAGHQQQQQAMHQHTMGVHLGSSQGAVYSAVPQVMANSLPAAAGTPFEMLQMGSPAAELQMGSPAGDVPFDGNSNGHAQVGMHHAPSQGGQDTTDHGTLPAHGGGAASAASGTRGHDTFDHGTPPAHEGGAASAACGTSAPNRGGHDTSDHGTPSARRGGAAPAASGTRPWQPSRARVAPQPAAAGSWDKERTWKVVNVEGNQLPVVRQPEPYSPGSGRIPPDDSVIVWLENGDIVKQTGHSKKVRGHMVMPVQLGSGPEALGEGWVTRRLVGTSAIWFVEASGDGS